MFLFRKVKVRHIFLSPLKRGLYVEEALLGSINNLQFYFCHFNTF